MSLSQAVLGAEIDVPTLGGVERVNIRSGSNSGDRILLKGRGIQSEERQEEGVAGDHIVELKVLIPRQVNERVRRIFEEFAKEENSYNVYDHHAEDFVGGKSSGSASFT